MEWTNVKDEMPCSLDDVLVWNGREREIYLCYERDHFEMYYSDITHWMPLPKPPSSSQGYEKD